MLIYYLIKILLNQCEGIDKGKMIGYYQCK